jgi:pimeloyl-ACP methyl ester carboxylesterase
MSQEERVEKLTWLVVSDDFANHNPNAIQQIKDNLMEQNFHAPGKIRQIKAFESADICDRLSEIKAPTLVLGGDVDRVTPLEYSRILASKISNAELVILKNTGHMFLEAGGENYKIILDFLKRYRLS